MANLDLEGLSPEKKIRIAAAMIAAEIVENKSTYYVLRSAQQIENYIYTGKPRE